MKWKAKNLFKATYRVFVDIFLKLGRADLAEKVCRLLVDEGMYKSSTAPHHLSTIVLYHSIILLTNCFLLQYRFLLIVKKLSLFC